MRFLVVHFSLYLLGLVARGQAAEPVPAFPGAEGYGAWATGGRGGRVIAVTNLADSGPGSLREALEKTREPRIVVFRVSGYIDLKDRIRLSHGNVTVAGQSAPGGGICLRRYGLALSGARNVIIRHLRIRPGDAADEEMDALTGEDCENVIIDHCSLSWATDETLTMYHNKNTTVQWCVISESLFLSAHHKGAHGYGGIWGGARSTWHHNLLAHHSSRNPRFARAESPIDYRNNLIYNWGFNSAYGGEESSVNLVANCYVPGPATDKRDRILEAAGEKSKWFVEDNLVVGSPGLDRDNWQGGVQEPWTDEAGLRLLKSLPSAYLTTETAEQAHDSVLEGAGATMPERDAHDVRVLAEVRSRSARFGKSYHGGGNGMIDTPADAGGWPALAPGDALPDKDGDGMPDAWEITHKLNPTNASDGPADEDEDGYTNVEEYLNGTLPRQFVDYAIPKQLPVQTVKPTQPAKFWTQEIIVAADGTGHFRDLREAIEAAPALADAPFPIKVMPGVYPGPVVIPEDKPLLRIESDGDGEVVVKGPANAPALQVSGGAFSAKEIVFQASGKNPAVVVTADRAVFRGCQLLGEDTALQLKTGRIYLRECRLEARNTLVVSAGAAAPYLDRCELHFAAKGKVVSIPKVSGRAYGAIFSRCVLSAAADVTGVLLADGSPDASPAAFLEMELPEFVDPAFRSAWTKRSPKDVGDAVNQSEFLGASDGWNPSAPAVPLAMLAVGPPEAPGKPVGLGGNGHVSLSWGPAENAVSYAVKREKDDASGFSTVVSGLMQPHWIDRNPGPIAPRRYVISAVSASGKSAEADPVTAMISGEGLPIPWALTAAGNGQAAFSNGTLSLRAPAFAWQAVTGDAEFQVHVSGFTGSTRTGSAGIRLQSKSADGGEEPFVALVIHANGRPELQWQASGGTVESLSGGSLPVPCWLKLTRQQEAFRGEVSADGATWKAIGEASLPLFAGPAYAGLSASEAEATFDGIAFPLPPPANAEK